jgi:hypothetical protein
VKVSGDVSLKWEQQWHDYHDHQESHSTHNPPPLRHDDSVCSTPSLVFW